MSKFIKFVLALSLSLNPCWGVAETALSPQTASVDRLEADIAVLKDSQATLEPVTLVSPASGSRSWSFEAVPYAIAGATLFMVGTATALALHIRRENSQIKSAAAGSCQNKLVSNTLLATATGSTILGFVFLMDGSIQFLADWENSALETLVEFSQGLFDGVLSRASRNFNPTEYYKGQGLSELFRLPASEMKAYAELDPDVARIIASHADLVRSALARAQ